MLLTTSIKLLSSEEQKKQLLETMYRFNEACNFISAYAFEHKIFNKFKVQKAIYYELREKFQLPAQFAIRAISRVIVSYKTDKKVQHTFKKTASVEYDQRLLNWKKLDQISILSLQGRLLIPIIFGEYAKLEERAIRNSATLIYKKGEFYLQAAVEVPEEQLQSAEQFLGVDLGIVNLATTSTGTVFSGEKVNQVRTRLTKLRGNLQACGTKSAKKHLKKISKQERNFKKNTNHIISNQIIKEAQRHGLGIALEDLSKIKKTVSRAQRDRFGKWAFYELITFIEYKAKIAGIETMKINPRNTSRTCHNCLFCDKKNRKSQSEFKCITCGYESNADLNAALNIAELGTLTKWAPVNEPIVAVKKKSPGKGRATNYKDLSRSI